MCLLRTALLFINLKTRHWLNKDVFNPCPIDYERV